MEKNTITIAIISVAWIYFSWRWLFKTKEENKVTKNIQDESTLTAIQNISESVSDFKEEDYEEVTVEYGILVKKPTAKFNYNKIDIESGKLKTVKRPNSPVKEEKTQQKPNNNEQSHIILDLDI